VELFKSLLQSDPSGAWSVEAAFHMGEALYDNEDYEAARNAYEITVRYGDAEWVFEALYGIGWTWFRESDWNRAALSFEKAAAAGVNDEQRARSRYRAGLCMASAGDWENSLVYYDQALAAHLGNWREEALYQKAWALLNLDRTEEAGETAAVLAREYPDSELPGDLPFRMGENAMAAGDYADAILWYDRCIADYPESEIAVRAELRAALASRESGNPEAAAERYGLWVLGHSENPGA
jgi:TolA-binding protein